MILRRAFAIGLLLALIPLTLDAQDIRPSCSAGSSGEKIALVLPGGGAKGFAHVGVIKVLDSLGIVPDLIVGTSMGSIMGGMFASGYNGADIEKLTKRFNIGPYIGKYSPRPPRAFGITGVAGGSALQSQVPGAPVPIVLLNRSQDGISLSTSLAQEGPVNMLLTAMMIRGNLIARGNFDSLPIPFRAVAADSRTGTRIVLDHGDLARAIRSSMAIPFVFEPGVLDSAQLVDGGLIENVPVKLARELGATRVILSTLDATRGLDSATRAKSKGTMDMMLDRIFLDTHPPLGPNDIEIRTDVSDVGNLDFAPAVVSKLTMRGAEAARKALVGACLPHRTRLAHATPPVVTSLVTADAVPGAARLMRSAVRSYGGYTQQTMRASMKDSATYRAALDTIQGRLAHAGTTGVLRSLWLTPESAAGDSAVFDPVIGWAQQRVIGLGAAFDNDLGGQAWIAASNRRAILKPLPPLEVGGRLTIGSLRQDIIISGRKAIQDVRYGISPFAALMLGRESSPFFTQTANGAATKITLPLFSEQLLQIGAEIPLNDAWTVQIGPLLRNYHGGLTQTNGTPTPLGFAVRIDEGDELASHYGRVDWELNQRFARFSGRYTFELPTSFASLTNTFRAGGVNRHAPYAQWFLLGGVDGFPGLNIGESTGTWTASYMLDVAHPLIGPVNLQLTGMTGTVSRDSKVNFGGEWLWGTRLGIGADPSIGLIRLQYGIATNGRHQWFARVGRWI